MEDLKIYIPITKTDEDKREVSGYASTESLDSQGEVVERSAIASALPAYLGDVDPKTGKFRFGNIREMHQMSAVGKTVGARIDSKGLFITGKVVDDSAWKKVKEGVYAGFSVGGRIIKQVGNRIKALRLAEISLVDRPACPDAVFSMVKIDDKGKITEMQKDQQEGSAVDAAIADPTEHADIIDASYILQMARDMRMLYSEFKGTGRCTKELERSLKCLKELAVKVLQGTDRQKFSKIFDAPEFYKNTMEMPTIPHQNVLEAAHVLDLARDMRMLLEMYEAQGKPTTELDRALTLLKKLAQRLLSEEDKKKFETILYGINFAHLDVNKLEHQRNKVVVTVEKRAVEDVKKYVDNAWAPGYFDQLKKVLG